MEDSIHPVDVNSVKTKYLDFSKRVVNSNKNCEQIHSTNLSVANQSDLKTYLFDRIAISFINLIEMTRKGKQQNTPIMFTLTKKMKARLQLPSKYPTPHQQMPPAPRCLH